jgi:hypothetical protein
VPAAATSLFTVYQTVPLVGTLVVHLIVAELRVMLVAYLEDMLTLVDVGCVVVVGVLVVVGSVVVVGVVVVGLVVVVDEPYS